MKTFSYRLSAVVAVCGLLMVQTACFKKVSPQASNAPTTAKVKTPEDVVRQFIDLSAASKEDGDRDKLKDICIGEMRRAFERMTPEAFRISYVNNNVKIKEVKILENVVEKDTARVRYQVTVENVQGTDPTQEAIEREVELQLTDSSWYISTIRPRGSDKIAFTRGMMF